MLMLVWGVLYGSHSQLEQIRLREMTISLSGIAKMDKGFTLKSRLQLMGVAIVICMAIYIPIFSPMTEFGRNNVQSITYGTLILTFLCYLLNGKKSKNIKGTFALYLFCLSFVLINLIHFLVGGGDELQTLLSNSHGFITAILIVLTVTQFKYSKQIYIFRILFGCISVMFLIQLALSAYESSLGVYIGGAEFLNDLSVFAADSLKARFIGNVVYNNMSSMLGLDVFNFSFTMMVGQHNAGGSQLVFYNLVFLFAYYTNKKIKYLTLAGLVIVAVLLNTTRYALASILITDFAFYMLVLKPQYYSKGVVRKFVFLSALIISVSWAVISIAYDNKQAGLIAEKQQFDTLNGRVEVYVSVWKHFLDQDSYHILLGNFGKEFTEVTITVLGFFRDFESLLIYVYYSYGFIGLGIIFYCLLLFTKQASCLIKPYRYFLHLIIFNVIAISVISGQLFTYKTLPIVIVLYLFVLTKSREFQKNTKTGV